MNEKDYLRVQDAYSRGPYKAITTGRKAQAIRRWFAEEDLEPEDLVVILADWALKKGWESYDPVLPNDPGHQKQAEAAKKWLSMAAYLRYEVVPKMVELHPPVTVTRIGDAAPEILDGSNDS
jgi:hypothetical protein